MKRSTFITQTNNKKRRERASSAVLFDVRAFILMLVMVLTMAVFATAVSINSYAAGKTDNKTEGKTVEVATFNQLQTALENTQGVSEIVIDPQAAVEEGDVIYNVEDDEESEAFYIGFDEPLSVPHEVTIRNAEGVDVYFARSDSFRRDQGKPALFNVDPSGTLNLDGLITMTGEEVTTTFNEEDNSFLFSVKSKDGTGEDNEVWNRGQVIAGGFYIQNNGGSINLGDDVILTEFHIEDDVDDVEAVYENDDIGLLFANRAANSTKANAVEEPTEEATEEATETAEEPIEVTPAPKKSLRSLKSPMLMNTQPQQSGTPTATPAEVTTWIGLQQAIKDAAKDGDTITITKSIVADKSQKLDDDSLDADGSLLLRGKTLTIKGPDGDKKVYIYRDDDADFPVFKVESGDELTLGNNLVLTGNTENCVSVIADEDKAFKVVYHNGGTGANAKLTNPETITGSSFKLKNPTEITENGWSAPEEGLVFKGWDCYGPKGGYNEKLAAGSTFNIPQDATYHGTMTLVAKWEKPATNKLTIELINGLTGNSAKGRSGGSYADSAVTNSMTFSLNATEEAEWRPDSNYKFVGWQWVSPTGQDRSSTGPTTDLSEYSGKHGTLTLVAKWEKYEGGKAQPLTSWNAIKNNSPVLMGELDKDGYSTGKFYGIDATPAYNGTGYWLTYDSDWWGENFRKFSINGPGYTPSPSGNKDSNDVARLLANDNKFFMQSGVHTFSGYVPYAKFSRGSDSGNGYPDEFGWGGSEYLYRFKLSSDGFLMTSSNGYLVRSRESGTNTFKSLSDKREGGIGFFTLDSIKNPGNAVATGTYYDNTSARNWTPSGGAFNGEGAENYKWASAAASQQCDGKCATYSTTANKTNNVLKFSGGTVGNEKAFFVQVNGGKLVLDGATLEDFITDGSVKYAAPIVVKGGSTSSTGLNFELKAGSTIRHNSVGYSADNKDRTWGNEGPASWQAQDIGLESELGDYEEKQGSLLRNWANTETAGALILSNGAKAAMSGGLIGENRGDTGAIVVQGLPDKGSNTVTATDSDRSTLKITGGTINNNVGIHHAGAIYIFNGGAVQMGEHDKVNVSNEAIKITNNFAWNKGGAIWAAEEAYASGLFKSSPGQYGDRPSNKPVGTAAFIMYSGTIDNNMAVERGGGIEVMSNHVALIGGNITNNTSRVLGGGIYVEGDPGKMYQLYIENGGITDNYAVNPNRSQSAHPDQVKKLQRIFNLSESDPDGNACGFKNNILENNTTITNADNLGFRNGFWQSYGNGGGIWLCSFGGNATLAIEDGADVVIDGNHKEAAVSGQDRGHGEDIFISAQGQGGNGILVLDQGRNNFVEEGTDNTLTEGKYYAGKLFLVNKPEGVTGTLQRTGGVNISGNVASNGGGIAANGTVLFGKRKDTYRASTTLKITKNWGTGIRKGVVKLKLQLLGENDEPLTVNGNPLELDGYEAILNGKPDAYTNSDANVGGETDKYGPNSIAHETGTNGYVAEMGLPLTAIDAEGDTVPILVFKVDTNDDGVLDTLDPSDDEDLQTIYGKLDSNSTSYDQNFWDNAELAVRIKVTESIKNGSNWEAAEPVVITPFGIDAANTGNVSKVSSKYKDVDGHEVGEFSVFTTNFALNHGIENNGREIELTKQGINNEILNGGTFKLFRATTKNFGGGPDYIVDSNYESQTITVVNGKLTIRAQGSGKYLLFEESAPDNYVTPKDPWIIDVNANGVATIYKNVGSPGKCWIEGKAGMQDFVQGASGYTTDYLTKPFIKWPSSWFTNGQVAGNVLQNEKASISLTKTDKLGAKINNNASFALYEANMSPSLVFNDDGTPGDNDRDIGIKKVNGVAAPAVNDNITTTDGSISVSNLDTSKLYLLFEKSAPTGYKRSKTPWLIWVKKDGTYSVFKYKVNMLKAGSENAKPVDRAVDVGWSNFVNNIGNRWYPSKYDFGQGSGSDGFNYEILSGDNATKLINEPITVEFDKIKKGTTEELTDAVFDLYYAKLDDNDDKYVVDKTKGDNGKAVSSIGHNGTNYRINIPDVSNKYYLLFETNVPEGYADPIVPWGIVVDADGNVTELSSGDEYGIWKVKDDALKGQREELASKDIADRYLYCSTSIIEKLTDYELENEPMSIELIKYKKETDTEYSDNSTKLSEANFQIIKLDTNSMDIADAREAIKPERSALVQITSQNALKDGLRIFLADTDESKEILSSIPGNKNAVYITSLDVSNYKDSELTDTITYYLEEHKIGEDTVYAFRTAKGQYINAEAGIGSNPTWAYVRLADRFYDGQQAVWESGVKTSLFRLNSFTISGQTGMDFRPVWRIAGNVKSDIKLRIKDEDGTFLSAEDADNTNNRGMDIYVESGDVYMKDNGNGTYTASNLSEGYYQIVETAAPEGYVEIPNDANHRMIIKVENGRVSVVSGGDSRFTLADNKLQLILSNDEMTEVPAKKVWGNGTVAEVPTNIKSVEFSLYAKKGETSTLVETRKVSGTNANDWTTTFNNLPKYYYDNEGRKEIVYEVVEGNVEGYTPTYSKDGNTLVVTNRKITGAKVNLTIDKKWVEGTPVEVIPESIQVQIWAGTTAQNRSLVTTVTLTAEDKWTLTERGLQRYTEDGEEIKYWIKEVDKVGFKQVSTEPDYVQATVGLDNYSQGNYEYTAYTVENEVLHNLGSKKQGFAHKEHFINRPDGTTEQVFCLNWNYAAPAERSTNNSTAGTAYTREEISASDFYKYTTPKGTYDLGNSGYTFKIDHYPDTTELYYKILRAIYLGSGGDAAELSKHSKIKGNSHLLAHMTQYAIYEYTDFWTEDYWFDYSGYPFYSYYTDKTKEVVEYANRREGRYESIGPRGLVMPQLSYFNVNLRVASGLDRPYKELMNLIEDNNNALTVEKLNQMGLRFYIYKPVLSEDPETEKPYQYLIGVDSAAVNMYASITNETEHHEITLYKHRFGEPNTYINGAEFELYEPDEKSTTTVPFGGQDKKVKLIGPYTTNSNGSVKIPNLIVGRTYYLKETKAANGYIKTDKIIAFKLTGDESASAEYPWTETTDKEVELKVGANVTTVLKVANKQIYDLPKSGGMGTYWFMVIGAMMMGFALTAGFTRMNILDILRR